MGMSQREAAFELLQTSLSAYGLQKSLDIISLQNFVQSTGAHNAC